MKSFSKLKLNFDKNDKGFCQVEIINKSGISKSGWIKFNEFLNWLFLNTKNNESNIGSIDFSKNLLTTKTNGKITSYYFLYNPSIRDIYAYQKGKYSHKSIFLPPLITEVQISNENINFWNIKLFAFNGELNANTKFYALKLPHFYNDGSLCLGNLTNLKKVQTISQFDNLLNYIFSTKFSH
ncbi:hypothetical protein [Spiroplasma taiwanense]|uniref:PRTRC system protein B n=1 Tax=Spiroplasma taiwanense CT-1 TaxID=1276220 RepID=S5MGW6_9MOLU|nr:hypothetical protein [Spiroplasma taiwanense]AGR41090.1 hypothetical protein STAIW_v1c04440 [Spiroplasma taiwanense CT-1]